MNKLISQSSMTSGNRRLKKLIEGKKYAILQDISDARICNDIAISLHSLRTQSGLTQKELAEKIGVKQSNISRWEQAGYQGYKVKMLNRIIRTLGGRLYISVLPPVTVQFYSMNFEHSNTRVIEANYADGTTMTIRTTENTKFEAKGVTYASA